MDCNPPPETALVHAVEDNFAVNLAIFAVFDDTKVGANQSYSSVNYWFAICYVKMAKLIAQWSIHVFCNAFENYIQKQFLYHSIISMFLR